MSIELRCVEQSHLGQVWTLDLDGPTAVIRGPSGEYVVEVYPEEAARRFQMPSFLHSIKYFGVLLNDQMWQFDVPKSGLKEIEAFINRSIVSSGLDAMLAIRNAAIRDVCIGMFCLFLGIVATAIGYQVDASKPTRGIYKYTWSVIFLGLFMIAKGIYGYVHYRRLEQI